MWNLINKNNESISNIERVYPIQQEDVSRVLQGIISTGKAKKVVIFGSSVSCRCSLLSDIDVYCELDKNFEFTEPYSACKVLPETPIDIWTNYMVNDILLEEINRRGVVVYERSNSI